MTPSCPVFVVMERGGEMRTNYINLLPGEVQVNPPPTNDSHHKAPERDHRFRVCGANRKHGRGPVWLP